MAVEDGVEVDRSTVVTRRELRRWSTVLLTVTAVLATASVVLHLTARGTAWHDVYSLFALSGEYNFAAYWNSALLAMVAVAACTSGLVSPSRRERWGWFVVAAVTAFMSVDEATQLHERSADLVTYNPLPTFAWVVVGAPLALGLVVVLWLATRTLDTRVRRRLALALALYLLGALVMEALSGYFWRQQRPHRSEAFGTVEEVLEMVACIYALHVIVSEWLPFRLSVRTTDGRAGARGGPPDSSPGVPR